MFRGKIARTVEVGDNQNLWIYQLLVSSIFVRNFERFRYLSTRLQNHTRIADGSYEVCQLGHHLGRTFTEMDRNGRAKLPHRTRMCGPCIAAIVGLTCKTCYGSTILSTIVAWPDAYFITPPPPLTEDGIKTYIRFQPVSKYVMRDSFLSMDGWMDGKF